MAHVWHGGWLFHVPPLLFVGIRTAKHTGAWPFRTESILFMWRGVKERGVKEYGILNQYEGILPPPLQLPKLSKCQRVAMGTFK